MKALLMAGAAALAISCIPSVAFAQVSVSNGSTASSTSTANPVSNSGAAATNIFNSPADIRSRSTVDTTANAFAPGLTSAGLNSCAGSTSIGGAGTGFSFGGGTTWEMEECTRRANAAALAGIGQVAAAREILCDSPAMARALGRTGYICLEQQAAYQEAVRRAQANGDAYVAYQPPEPEPLPVVAAPARNARGLRSGPPRARRATRAQKAEVAAAVDQQLSNSGR